MVESIDKSVLQQLVSLSTFSIVLPEKYIKPEMNIELFENEDVITASGKDESSGRILKKIVNGNEGADYGSQEVSVFE